MARKQTTTQLDPNQPVFVGIDVHKKSWSVCLVHCDEEIGICSIPGDFRSLAKILKRFEGMEIYSVYEAGFSGFWLHRRLAGAGVRNLVIAPNKVPVVVGDLVKTDRRDSRKLAQSLSKGLLKGIHIPPEEQVNARQLLRTREQIKRKRIRAIQQIKMLLLQFNIKLPVGLSKETQRQIETMDLPEHVSNTATCLIKEVEFFEVQLKFMTKKIHEECMSSNHEKNYQILKSVPGYGPLTAGALCLEIGDWRRFQSASKLSAFLGLTPREYSSGERVYRGRITGQGNTWLRSYLIESSWRAIEVDPAIREFYERIKNNTGSGRKAAVAVARKLLQRAHSAILQERKYVLGKTA
jgi:transposase